MAHKPNSLVIRRRIDDQTEVRKQIFLTALEQLLNVSVACKVTGLSRAIVYDWRKNDPDFAAKWEDAIELAQGSMESSVYLKLAGILTDERRKIDMPAARLIELMLGGFYPDKYKQRPLVDQSTKTISFSVDWSQVSDDVLDAFNRNELTLEDVYQISLQQRTSSRAERTSEEGTSEES